MSNNMAIATFFLIFLLILLVVGEVLNAVFP